MTEVVYRCDTCGKELGEDCIVNRYYQAKFCSAGCAGNYFLELSRVNTKKHVEEG